MEKQLILKKNQRLLSLLKALVCAYLATGILLMILAFLLYRFRLKESQIQVGITAIYVIATVLGGFLGGKFLKTKKYLWGLVIGTLYYLLLLAVSFGVYKSLGQSGVRLFATFLLCAGGGMIGGMIS